jgi:16S rRNA (adenine1518-N6/adenine1519-N6)-dimethyltransferase
MAAEYLDVVNEDNQVTGQASRQVIHASGWWHRGVHVFLFTPDRRLLVQKRGRAQDTYPGALDCSVSEHLKVGETYREAALRGLREELGLPAIELTRLLQFRMNYGPGDNMINELYKGILDGAAPRIDHQEIARIAYYTLPELEEMMRAGETPFSSWFVQLLRWYTGKPTTMQVLIRTSEPIQQSSTDTG